jgi:hypothetical protein
MLLLIFIVYLGITIRIGKKMDALLIYQHDEYYDWWLADGGHRGMFYIPKGCSVFASLKLSFGKHKNVPDWVEGDIKAEKLHEEIVSSIKHFKFATYVYLFSIIYFVFLS